MLGPRCGPKDGTWPRLLARGQMNEPEVKGGINNNAETRSTPKNENETKVVSEAVTH